MCVCVCTRVCVRDSIVAHGGLIQRVRGGSVHDQLAGRVPLRARERQLSDRGRRERDAAAEDPPGQGPPAGAAQHHPVQGRTARGLPRRSHRTLSVFITYTHVIAAAAV